MSEVDIRKLSKFQSDDEFLKMMKRKINTLKFEKNKKEAIAKYNKKIANNMIGVGLFLGINHLLDQDPDEIINDEEDPKLKDERGKNYKIVGVNFRVNHQFFPSCPISRGAMN